MTQPNENSKWCTHIPIAVVVNCKLCGKQIGGIETDFDVAKNAAYKLGARVINFPFIIRLTASVPVCCADCLKRPLSDFIETETVEEVCIDCGRPDPYCRCEE